MGNKICEFEHSSSSKHNIGTDIVVIDRAEEARLIKPLFRFEPT